MRRRDLSGYEVFQQGGVELLISPGLAQHTRSLHIDLKRFLFLGHLKGVLELSNGLVLGRRHAWD